MKYCPKCGDSFPDGWDDRCPNCITPLYSIPLTVDGKQSTLIGFMAKLPREKG